MVIRNITILLLVLLVVGCKKPISSEQLANRGKYLYDTHCASCHGVKGDGQGPMAKSLWPKPRDFTSGIIKYRTTRGPVPRDIDLLQTMKVGIPGTSMPGWDMLGTKDWQALLSYLKSLSPNIKTSNSAPLVDVPEQPAKSTQLVQEGKVVYETSGCVSCHGPEGRANGPAAATLHDVWGDTIAPRDLTRGPLKWGNTEKEIYRTMMTGIPGTPMPAFEHTLSPDKIWRLVYYLKSIQKVVEGYDPSNPKRFLISAEKVVGDIPLDVHTAAWTSCKQSPVFLKQMWGDNKGTEWLDISALQNGKEIAFHVSWEDDKQDIKPNAGDGVAIQFPIKKVEDAGDLPYLGMGSAGHPVEVWFWQPDKLSVLRAEGSERVTPRDTAKGSVTTAAKYENGRWHVIFKRPLNEDGFKFAPNGYLSFALWDADLQRPVETKAFSEWLMYEIR